MLITTIENIFDIYPEAVIHPINCIGLSHDPLTKKMKRVWPDYCREYARACMRKQLKPYHTYHYSIYALFGTKHILTMTVKNNWQEKVKVSNLEPVFESLIQHCKKQNIKDLAIPITDELSIEWIIEMLQQKCNKFNYQNLKQIYFVKNS